MGKQYRILILFALLFPVRSLLLQGWTNTLKASAVETPYRAERKDLYNRYGLLDRQTLSSELLLESSEYALYSDRILSLCRHTPGSAQYAADTAAAVLAEVPALKRICILPIPQRAVLEADFPQKKEEYAAFAEELKTLSEKNVLILDPLPELLAHQEENLFYRTENAWTMDGAFYGAQVFRQAMGFAQEDLTAYRDYMFGTFSGKLKSLASQQLVHPQLNAAVENMESEPFHIRIKGSDPNREMVTMKNSAGEIVTIPRRTIVMNSNGPEAVIAPVFFHSMVEGEGVGSLIFVTDDAGKLMIPFLTDLYEKIYVVSIMQDKSFMQTIGSICTELDADTLLWAQQSTHLGRTSYMPALNPFAQRRTPS